MSDESEQLKIKDLVFFKEKTVNSAPSIDTVEGYTIDNMPLDNMHGAQSLNLIIGANNSGKSRFIRKLLKLDFRLITNENWNDLIKFSKELAPYLNTNGGGNIERHINLTNLNNDILVNINDTKSILNRANYTPSVQTESMNKIYESISNVKYLKLNNPVYIPALRTAHTLYDDQNNPLKQDFYLNTINKNYPETQNKDDRRLNNIQIDVFTGLNLYEEIRKARNSIREIRKRFENFELFLSRNFFDGKEVDVVALDEEGTRRINIHIDGSESNKDIHQLGDGIQAIIILMYKIFMADSNSLIVIDEPEQHLHPGLQRIFIESTLKLLKERNNNSIIFIVTHSNHLMDLTLTQEDVSIYSFSKDKDDENSQIKVRACKAGDYSLLSELGVTSSSAFIANTSIWVEGPTDRKYLRFFLNKYFEKFNTKEDFISLKEDIDYAFYEYAGSLLSHYNFDTKVDENPEIIDKIKAFALANRIFLLADRDSTSNTGTDEKSKRLKLLKEISLTSTNFSFNKTTGIEIENMLPKKIYEDYVHTLYRGSPSFIVKQNIEDSLKNYKGIKIGTALLKAIKPNSYRDGIKDHKKFVSNDGGLTTFYKTSLCDFVCENYSDKSYTDLVKPNSGLDRLIRELYKFIISS